MPKKCITVEMLTTVSGVGRQGEILEVSVAQARNQLIPKGLARESSGEKTSDPQQRTQEKRHDYTRRLHGEEFTVTVEGSATTLAHHFGDRELAQEILRKYHISLEPSMIQFVDVKHPKKPGKYQVRINIADDAFAQLSLILKT